MTASKWLRAEAEVRPDDADQFRMIAAELDRLTGELARLEDECKGVHQSYHDLEQDAESLADAADSLVVEMKKRPIRYALKDLVSELFDTGVAYREQGE